MAGGALRRLSARVLAAYEPEAGGQKRWLLLVSLESIRVDERRA